MGRKARAGTLRWESTDTVFGCLQEDLGGWSLEGKASGTEMRSEDLVGHGKAFG